MEHIFDNRAAIASVTEANADAARPAYQAYQILHLGFVVAPIVAGLDKFSISWSIGSSTSLRLSTTLWVVTAIT